MTAASSALAEDMAAAAWKQARPDASQPTAIEILKDLGFLCLAGRSS